MCLGLIHTCQSCLLVTCHLQGKTSWPYWHKIMMNFNLLATSNISMVWMLPQDEMYWMLQYRIFLSLLVYLIELIELYDYPWGLNCQVSKGKGRSLLKIVSLLDYLLNPPATRDFFDARKENVNLRVIMISYNNKGFILALVLHVHAYKFQFPRTHLFFTPEILQSLCRPQIH